MWFACTVTSDTFYPWMLFVFNTFIEAIPPPCRSILPLVPLPAQFLEPLKFFFERTEVIPRCFFSMSVRDVIYFFPFVFVTVFELTPEIDSWCFLIETGAVPPRCETFSEEYASIS